VCYPLILGSEEPLPISQYAPQEEDKEDGQIYVRAIGQANSRDARAIFATRYLYYIFARHTGDACGFSGNYEEAQAARRELAEFLERSLELVADLRLYAAYEDFGDSGALPTKFDYIAPSDIRTWVPGFLEGDFFQVLPDDSPEVAEQVVAPDRRDG
jgi:hypothetical protein